MSVERIESFLGTWQLIPSSCNYEQGDPPREGTYHIALVDGLIVFTTWWIDADGEEQSVQFSGPPDGSKQPFAGGKLADTMAIDAVSDRELNSYAYFEGRELMVAQRQLDATGHAMRVTQLVRLPGGVSPANVSIYRRVEPT